VAARRRRAARTHVCAGGMPISRRKRGSLLRKLFEALLATAPQEAVLRDLFQPGELSIDELYECPDPDAYADTYHRMGSANALCWNEKINKRWHGSR
jgi:hypothetical protein